MLKCTPDSFKDEIRAAVEFSQKFIKHNDMLVRRYAGRYYRADKMPDRAVVDNHAYEYLSVILPSIIFDNPQCRMRSVNSDMRGLMPRGDGLVMTVGDKVKGIELSLNRWSVDDEVSVVLRDVAVDFQFCFGVLLTTIVDQPGWQGVELLPSKPHLMRIDPRHFMIDPCAMTWRPNHANGPRYMGHMWKADVDDLLDDPDFDKTELTKLAADTDTEEYDYGVSKSLGVPDRNELLIWDVWVPEKQLSDVSATMGCLYPLAVSMAGNGQTGKKMRWIRQPRPAYCGPWGPYTIFGAYKVPGSPYPLSPLVATAEQAEETNAHTAAAAEDARAHKRFILGPSTYANAVNTVKNIKNGDVAVVEAENPREVFQEFEVGGVSEEQYKYIQDARDRLNRVSGLSDSMRGQTRGDITATESAIADKGTHVRVAGMQSAYRACVTRVWYAAAWFMWYDDGIRYDLGAEGEKVLMPEYRGGVYPGEEHFNFFDLSLVIDPLSLEYTDEATIQRRMQTAHALLLQTIPIMPQAPYVRWRGPISALFNSLNIPNAEEWIDFDMLEQMTAAGMAGGGAPGQTTFGNGGDQQIPLLGRTAGAQIGADAARSAA